MNILEVKQLTKRYHPVEAVKGISFNVTQGTCFGLLGPNGAGKTTTLEMIEGITRPTSGEILFQGKRIDKHFKKKAGIQFQETALPDFLTTSEILELFSSFYTETIDINTIIEQCDLGEFLDTYATKLSGGQRQRLLLALAILNNPDIIFLDEPTTGLDPHSRRKFWALIDRIKQQGKTILLTTHYMEEAAFLCDELIIMDHGEIIEQGEPLELVQKHFKTSYISLNRKNVDAAQLDAKTIHAESIEWLEDKCLIFSNRIPDTLSALLTFNLNLDSMHIHQPTLEDLFLKLTGHALNE